MATIKNLADQLLAHWRGLSSSARVISLVGLLLMVLCAAAVGLWSARPHFIPLSSGLSPTETAEIVSRLDGKGIPYKLNFSGSAVLVPKSNWNAARVVVGDIASVSSEEHWNDGMLGDPSLSRYRMYQRRQESLARTIRKMAGVTNATVHIAVSERSPFISDQRPVTASVVLEVAQGASFTREQADAIVALVAGSVEGLDRDRVTVMDTRGRILSSSSGYAGAEVSSHLEFCRQVESDLAAKANILLAQMLGENRSLVRVSVDVDFTTLERTETKYDPNLKVRTEEEIRSFQKTSADRTVGGPAGLESNLGGSTGTLTAAIPMKETEESNTTKYETAKTVDIVKQAPGKINRLTVAVMADLSKVATTGGASTDAGGSAPATISKNEIASIVKQAVGFDESRGDQIEVLITPFADMSLDDDPMIAARKWELVNTVLRNASLGVASLVALILGLLTLRKMRPLTIPVDPVAKDDQERSELLANLSKRIQQNPKAMQTILSAWLNESSDGPGPRPDGQSRAA